MQPTVAPPGPLLPAFGLGPRSESPADAYVMLRHELICPNRDELSAVLALVTACETALKAVSDKMQREGANNRSTSSHSYGSSEKIVPRLAEAVTNSNSNRSYLTNGQRRALTGIVRVGALARGLLLSCDGQLDVDLVMLCSTKPSRTLLARVAAELQRELDVSWSFGSSIHSSLQKIAPHEYDVTPLPDEGRIGVSTLTPPPLPRITVRIAVTSTLYGDDWMSALRLGNSSSILAEDEDGMLTFAELADLLDRNQCLTALDELARVKWFQVNHIRRLPSALIVIVTS